VLESPAASKFCFTPQAQFKHCIINLIANNNRNCWGKISKAACIVLASVFHDACLLATWSAWPHDPASLEIGVHIFSTLLNLIKISPIPHCGETPHFNAAELSYSTKKELVCTVLHFADSHSHSLFCDRILLIYCVHVTLKKIHTHAHTLDERYWDLCYRKSQNLRTSSSVVWGTRFCQMVRRRE
jgi:hypothetical protein